MATVWQAKYSLRNLYNGNISTCVNAYRAGDAASVTGEQYSYDMLNRITASKYNNLAAGTATPTPKFATSYSYDLNGNILNLNRSGNQAATDAPDMDKLTYSYEAKTNKLKAVKDEVGSDVYADVDIDNQVPVVAANDTDKEEKETNYRYDAIGNMKEDKQAGVTIRWTVYGKVAEVIPAYSATNQKPHVKYTYDAAGNRIVKQVNTMPYATPTSTVEVNNPAKVATTFYLRDATGNTMAVYERYNSKVASNYTATYTQREVSLYGSDRLGTFKPDINTPLAVVPFALLTSANLPAMVPTAPAAQLLATRTVGLKEYELKDHLGNVRAVVSDTKSGSAQTFYDALAAGTYHYYPFGMAMPSLGSVSGQNAYRYGFGSQERDDEVLGSGNSYTAKYWQYDSRLGRRWNVDPLAEKYPHFSSYAYCFNNPLIFIDPDGRDPIYGKNFWGNVKLIGDDGQKSTGSYLVKGSVAREVKTETKAGKFYTGSLAESKKVMHVPTGQIQQDVQQTATATINSGTSPDTRVENGGHTLKGDANARIWDSGTPVKTSTDADGNTTKTWSVTPFKIGGKKNQVGGPASSIQYIWHIHPNGSTPSDADFNAVSNWRDNGFTGNSFLINVNNGIVTFFNEKRTITNIKYSDFIRMGNQEEIK